MSSSSTSRTAAIYRRIRWRCSWPKPKNLQCPFCLETIAATECRRASVFIYIGKSGPHVAHVSEFSEYILSDGKPVCPMSRDVLSIVDIIRLDGKYAKWLKANHKIASTHLAVRTFHPKWIRFKINRGIHEEACDAFTSDVQDYTFSVIDNIQRGQKTHELIMSWPDMICRVHAFNKVDRRHVTLTMQTAGDTFLEYFPHPKAMLFMHFYSSLIHDSILDHGGQLSSSPSGGGCPEEPILELYNGDMLPSVQTVRKWIYDGGGGDDRDCYSTSTGTRSTSSSSADEGMTMEELTAATIATHAWHYMAEMYDFDDDVSGEDEDVDDGGDCGDPSPS